MVENIKREYNAWQGEVTELVYNGVELVVVKTPKVWCRRVLVKGRYQYCETHRNGECLAK